MLSLGRSVRVRTRIDARHADFTRSEQAVADQLRRHGIEIAFSPAASVSRQLGVSEATLVRFARTLGYDSYQHLQKDVQDEIRQHLTSTSLSRVRRRTTGLVRQHEVFGESLRRDLANIEATLEENSNETIGQAVQLLTEAQRVWVLGMRASAGLAMFLGHALHYLLPSVRLLSSGLDMQFEELLGSGQTDALLVVSLSRSARRVTQLTQYARERGAQVVLITDNPLSNLSSLAAVRLVAQSESGALIQSHTAAMAVGMGLISAIGAVRPDLVERRLSEMEYLFQRFHT